MKLIKSFVPHSRCFCSYFDVIFLMYLVSSGFSFKPTSSCSSSSSSTQFSQEWARRKVVVKHSIKSNLQLVYLKTVYSWYIWIRSTAGISENGLQLVYLNTVFSWYISEYGLQLVYLNTVYSWYIWIRSTAGIYLNMVYSCTAYSWGSRIQ